MIGWTSLYLKCNIRLNRNTVKKKLMAWKKCSASRRPRRPYMSYFIKSVTIIKTKYFQNQPINQLAESLLRKWTTKFLPISKLWLLCVRKYNKPRMESFKTCKKLQFSSQNASNWCVKIRDLFLGSKDRSTIFEYQFKK